MTGVSDAGSIRVLLADPTVRRTFAFALVGRLAYGVLPLCFLFTVRDASGSLAIAATSSAILGFATLAMPVQARLIDRYGQRRILPAYTACYMALLGLAAALSREVDLTAVWLTLGLLLGLSSPALGPAMRAQWREIAGEGPSRRRAYSLDSVGEESLYLVGPIAAGAVLALGPAWVGLLLTAALVGCGTTALATSPHRPRSAGAAPALVTDDGRRAATATSPRHGLLRQPRFVGLLAVMGLFGSGGAACFVGVAALADNAGRPGVAGVVEAATATGAVVGGVLWAHSGSSGPASRVLALLLILVGAAQALTGAVAPNLVLVGALLAGGALASSPVFVTAFSSVDLLVRSGQRTEASTWVTVSANVGTAAGTALAGVSIGISDSAPFLLAAALTVLAVPITAVSGRPARPPS